MAGNGNRDMINEDRKDVMIRHICAFYAVPQRLAMSEDSCSIHAIGIPLLILLVFDLI